MPTQWHVQIFRLPTQHRRKLLHSKRENPGFGWSASGEPEGYHYSKGPFPTAEAAESAARARLEGEDSIVISVGISLR